MNPERTLMYCAPPPTDNTMNPLLTEWRLYMARGGKSPATIKRRLGTAERCSAWLGHPLTAATTDDLHRWLDRYPHPDTRSHYGGDLIAFYLWAMRAGHVTSDPSEHLIRPPRTKMRPRPHHTDDLAEAIRQAPPKVRIVIALSALAALRAAEIAGLEGEDVDLTRGTIYVACGKGGKSRTVPICPALRTELVRYGVPRYGPVVAKQAGGAYKPGSVSAMASHYFRRLGLPTRLHRGRHWFATALIEQGEDVRVIAELMGHSSIQTTAGYSRVSAGRMRRAVDHLELPDVA